MAKQKLKFQYNPVRTYPVTNQLNYVGAQTVAGRRGVLPTFTDSNTKYVATTGSDAAAGTSAAPYRTPDYARSQLGGAFKHVVIKDGGVYNTAKILWDKPGILGSNNFFCAADGFAPTLTLARGVGIVGPGDGADGSYGARPTHGAPTAPAAGFAIAYVRASGNDATAVKGNALLPFRTIQAAINSTVSGDHVWIRDSSKYIEDLNAGAKALVIKADTGCNPTLINVGITGASKHIQNSGGLAITLFALNIQETVDQAGTAVYCPGGDVFIRSCTISNGAQAISCATGSLENSYIYNPINGVLCTGAFAITNCLMTQMRGVPGYGVRQTATTGLLSITWSTFSNWCKGISGSWSVSRDYPAGTFNTLDVISNCVFDGYDRAIQFGQNLSNGISGTGFPTITNCLFQNGKYGMVMLPSPGTTIVRECLFKYNTSEDGLFIVGANSVNFQARLYSCVSIGNKNVVLPLVAGLPAGGGCFTMRSQGSAAFNNATLTMRAYNCTVVNAAGPSFVYQGSDFSQTSTNSFAMYLDSCVINKCAGPVIWSDNSYATLPPVGFHVDYSIYENDWAARPGGSLGTGSAKDNSFQGDAKLVSTVPGLENIALAPDSPALLSGRQAVSDDRGTVARLFELSASYVTVNGIIFKSESNLRAGVVVDAGVQDAAFVACTMDGGGPFGFKTSGNGTILINTAFDGVGGIFAGSTALVAQNTFVGCPGAGILNAQPGNTIQNNSSYECLYGQYDFPAIIGNYNGNIYSQSGVLDYSGRGTHAYACVGTLSPEASLAGTSIQLDPLFRDPDEGDLRLQTVEFDFAYNSPCKKTGVALADMGAFIMQYGTLATSWTAVNFGTSKWINPSRLSRHREFLHLAEGVREDNTTFSGFTGSRRVYDAMWDEDQNMPAAQLLAIENMLAAQGGAQVDFGAGAGWQDCEFIRSVGFDFEEIGGSYIGGTSTDALPTPVRQISFRLQA